MCALWRVLLVLLSGELCQRLEYREVYPKTNLQRRFLGIPPVLAIRNTVSGSSLLEYDTAGPIDLRYPVQHAGLPRDLAVEPLPLAGSDHELVFNVSWQPSYGPPARDYSIEVISETNTNDCRSPICYEYDIHGGFLWHLVPTLINPVVETCAIRPGCAYHVRLIAHPWDGHTTANLRVQLDECVAGVCSCAHAPRLPAPVVRAQTTSIQGEIAVNVSWTLPPPQYPQRLPRGLQKDYYFVSIGKQMVSDAHPSPWFAHSITRELNVDGPVVTGDEERWVLVPIAERSGERGKKQSRVLLDVKLLARVNLVDERGCVGPAGNTTAFDPVVETNKTNLATYALWAVFGGVCVLTMVVILALSARLVKRILNAFRPAQSAPLEPLRRRPAWFPLLLRANEVQPLNASCEHSMTLEPDSQRLTKELAGSPLI